MKLFVFFCFLLPLCFTSVAQCVDEQGGSTIFRDNFGGNYSTGDFGPPLVYGYSVYAYNNSGTIVPGEYGLRKKTNRMNGWIDGADHTGQGGYMLLVNTRRSSPVFYETTLANFCVTPKQTICFSAASLHNSGEEPVINVEVHNYSDNRLIASFKTEPLKNKENITWSDFSFSYSVQGFENKIKISFIYNGGDAADFALDDIKVANIGGASSVATGFLTVNGKFDYPVYACRGERVVISPGGNPSQYTNFIYQWESGKTGSDFDIIPGATKAIYVIDSATRDDSRFYRLRISDSGSYGCYTLTYAIGLRIDPDPVIITNSPVCEGDSLILKIDAGSIVNWAGPNNFAASGTKVKFDHAKPQYSGTYTVEVAYGYDCPTREYDTVNVLVNPNPIHLNLPYDTAICNGNPVTLNAFNEGASYNWTTGVSSPQIVVTKKGTYGVRVYKQGCTQDAISVVDVQARPLLNLGRDTTICFGQSLILGNKPHEGETGKYVWSTGSDSPQITIDKAGEYGLKLSNVCGSSTDVIKVDIIKCNDDLFVPNAFTPNHDGLNDIFMPGINIGLKDYTFIIYNRWGQKVFQSKNIERGWDGTFNGILQPMGVYIWHIRYKGPSGKSYVLKGYVTLIE